MITKLPDSTIQQGIKLLKINPIQFYKKGEGRLAFRDAALICKVCELGKWAAGTSYFDMYEKAFGIDGANFIHNLPAVIEIGESNEH